MVQGAFVVHSLVLGLALLALAAEVAAGTGAFRLAAAKKWPPEYLDSAERRITASGKRQSSVPLGGITSK